MKVLVDRERRAYKPGQIVPISGIYGVIHNLHRSQHDVLAIRGEEFPLCRICKSEVRFHVVRPVPHMTHDFDLTGPASEVVSDRAKAAKKGSV